jgi:hypothetical protein
MEIQQESKAYKTVESWIEISPVLRGLKGDELGNYSQ